MDDPKKLLEAFEPKEFKVLQKAGGREFSSVRYSPCGKFLLGAGFDAKISRWNVTADEPQELPPLAGHNGWVSDLAFDPTGQFVWSADTWGQLRCAPLAEENPAPRWSVAAAHDGWIQSLALSADGKLVATGGNDRKVRVWSAEDGRKLHEFDKHTDPVLRVGFHPDGKSLVSGEFKGIVNQFDVAAGTFVRQFDAGVLFKLDRLQDTGGVRALAFTPDGALLAVGGTKPANGGNVQGIPAVLVFDWGTGALKQSLELGVAGDVYVTDIRFHPAGFLMCTISGNPGAGKLVYQRLEDSAPFFSNTSMANLHSLSLHPNKTRVAVAGTNAGSNGNGRLLKDGEYPANWSPIWLLDMPKPVVPSSGG